MVTASLIKDRLRMKKEKQQTKVLQSQSRSMENAEVDLVEKLDELIEMPQDYLRRLTMPPCEEEKWNQFQCIVYPMPGLVFSAWVITLSPSLWWCVTM